MGVWQSGIRAALYSLDNDPTQKPNNRTTHEQTPSDNYAQSSNDCSHRRSHPQRAAARRLHLGLVPSNFWAAGTVAAPPPMNLQHWHTRYLQQARWSKPLRDHLWQRLGLGAAQNILEVGCGTGALLQDLLARGHAQLWGVDISPAALQFASPRFPSAHLTQADAACLPFVSNTFDVTFCHFLLLWLPNPQAALREMRRVTHPGGWVLALAEPDYQGRIDAPAIMQHLGAYQNVALQRQGANIGIGRQLGGLFADAGLSVVETGLLGGQWQPELPDGWDLEWDVFENDIQDFHLMYPLQELRRHDREAWLRGERVLFVPTFYALAKV